MVKGLNLFLGQNITVPLGLDVRAWTDEETSMTPRRFSKIKSEENWRELVEMAAAVARGQMSEPSLVAAPNQNNAMPQPSTESNARHEHTTEELR
jgi:hypothetical protein